MSIRNSERESGEEAPFLAYEKDALLTSEAEEGLTLPKRSRSTLTLGGHIFPYLFHLCFLVANVLWFTANSRYQSASCRAHGTPYGRP